MYFHNKNSEKIIKDMNNLAKMEFHSEEIMREIEFLIDNQRYEVESDLTPTGFEKFKESGNPDIFSWFGGL